MHQWLVKSLIPKVMIVNAIAKKMTPVTTVQVSHSVGSQKVFLLDAVGASEIGMGSRRIRDRRAPGAPTFTGLRRIFDSMLTRCHPYGLKRFRGPATL